MDLPPRGAEAPTEPVSGMSMGELRNVLDEALQPVLTTRGRGEVMSRLRPVVQRMLDDQAEAIAQVFDRMEDDLDPEYVGIVVRNFKVGK